MILRLALCRSHDSQWLPADIRWDTDYQQSASREVLLVRLSGAVHAFPDVTFSRWNLIAWDPVDSCDEHNGQLYCYGQEKRR